MPSFSFFALGTEWSVIVDVPNLSPGTEAAVLEYVKRFELRFSRFLAGSEVNAFRRSIAGVFPVSSELAELLGRAERLRQLTGGRYDPAVAGVLEAAGYGPREEMPALQHGPALPRWSVAGKQLSIDGPIAFDFGGIGKGYCIDRVADIVRGSGHSHFLVDGGGDMVATEKADGTAWHVAIEYPGKPDLAVGTVELRHQGLAVSDSFRRRFGRWHHLIDHRKRSSIQSVLGCAAVAPDAWSADCMTSGLFFGSPDQYPVLAREFGAGYLVFREDGRTAVSRDWPGELF